MEGCYESWVVEQSTVCVEVVWSGGGSVEEESRI